ncbi:hypothetical protein BWD09_13605, partial [Neisseria dentiae]
KLAQTQIQLKPATVPMAKIFDTEPLHPSTPDDAKGNTDVFAVGEKACRRLVQDLHGKFIPFQTASGFSNIGPVWQSGSWRYLYLHDKGDGHTVSVSQRLKERFSTLISALCAQFAVSLLALPALFFL